MEPKSAGGELGPYVDPPGVPGLASLLVNFMGASLVSSVIELHIRVPPAGRLLRPLSRAGESKAEEVLGPLAGARLAYLLFQALPAARIV
jgi:hypothetical protein